ncbi:uncharacterized protein LAJ45_11346 [Morchella importuna]|uniref:uncharacterized protein n=1 Tax=Morchella importuna TaxID=1174673 RepID=UPI001E8D3AAA|nr:uncharacterized protein LAJ45_11346 [Morchella importuna]KAH8144638.1 hypothetical protein LAJ45_11346 [Morchella importuna]
MVSIAIFARSLSPDQATRLKASVRESFSHLKKRLEDSEFIRRLQRQEIEELNRELRLMEEDIKVTRDLMRENAIIKGEAAVVCEELRAALVDRDWYRALVLETRVGYGRKESEGKEYLYIFLTGVY